MSSPIKKTLNNRLGPTFHCSIVKSYNHLKLFDNGTTVEPSPFLHPFFKGCHDAVFTSAICHLSPHLIGRFHTLVAAIFGETRFEG